MLFQVRRSAVQAVCAIPLMVGELVKAIAEQCEIRALEAEAGRAALEVGERRIDAPCRLPRDGKNAYIYPGMGVASGPAETIYVTCWAGCHVPQLPKRQVSLAARSFTTPDHHPPPGQVGAEVDRHATVRP